MVIGDSAHCQTPKRVRLRRDLERVAEPRQVEVPDVRNRRRIAGVQVRPRQVPSHPLTPLAREDEGDGRQTGRGLQAPHTLVQTMLKRLGARLAANGSLVPCPPRISHPLLELVVGELTRTAIR